ncbi:hypothetical protein [Chryseobacterium vrystaatense]|uniref:C1q domain-containing protein n=1 Tax=Chryseobacterium vrystaatense TaxID=307480 RepID=A0A1M5DMY7_9FLAO|nr:hypothetical protein [Chryseobacterium vrystaatense]SHF68369.1 hypothetical protein SAMN02787073_2659 [Chryseobacterium vrystaatense]
MSSVATGSAAGTTVNMNETGYYCFDGSVWLRFNDVGVAPLTKAAFNGSGTYNDAAETVADGVVKKISFPAVNITADPEIGVWSTVNNEMTVRRKGVFTVAASLLYEDCSNTTSAFLVIKAGSESETTATNILIDPTSGTTGPFTQRNNLSASFVLNSGDKIWVEASRANLGWAVGKRSVNITFSETN